MAIRCALVDSRVECPFGAFSHLAPLLVLERRGFVDARKRFILGNGDIEEGAERSPPLLDLKDQQPIRSNRLAHCLIVPSKDGLAVRPIAETIVEGALAVDLLSHR